MAKWIHLFKSNNFVNLAIITICSVGKERLDNSFKILGVLMSY